MRACSPILLKGLAVFMLGMLCLRPLSAIAQDVQDAPAAVNPPRVDPAQIAIEKLDFANGLFQRGFYEMALVEYQNLIEEFSDFERVENAHIGRAESLFFLKRYDEALESYRVILRKFPQTSQRPVVMVRIGQCWYHLKQYGRAGKIFAGLKVADLSSDLKPVYLFYYGESLKALKQPQKAREFLQQVLDLEPADQQSWLAMLELAEIETGLKNNEGAAARFQQAFEHAVSDEDKSQVLYRQGKAWLAAQQYDEALTTFQMLLDQFPDQSVTGQAGLSLIATLYQSSQFLEITRFYETHIEMWDFIQENYDIFKIVVKAFESTQQPHDALFVVEGILKDPDLPLERRKELSIIQADLLGKTKQFSRLKELAQSAPEDLWPEDYRLFALAEANYGLGDDKAALHGYSELQKKFPHSSWITQAIYGRAFVHQRLGQNPEAIHWFNQFYRLSKEDGRKPEALYNILVIEHQIAAWNNGIETAEKFLSAFPQAPEAERAQYFLGYFHFKQEDYARAAEALRAFIDRYPQSELKARALFYLGSSYQSENNTPEALKFYDMVSADVSDVDMAASAMTNKAILYLKEKQNEKAAQELHHMVELASTQAPDPDLILWLVEYDVSRQNDTQALQILQSVKSRWSGENWARAEYWTADIHRRNHQCSEALSAFDEVLKQETDSSFKGLAYLGKADCLAQMQRYPQARNLLKEVLETYRNDTFVTLRAKFEAARLEEAQGHFEEAAKLYMLVAVLYKDETIVPEALERAGAIFEKLDKKADAVKVYTEIMRDYSGSAYFQKAQERIKVLQ